MYVDYAYYEKTYMSGRQPLVSKEDFPFFEKQAEREVDNRTFDRIRKDPQLITNDVKDCVCSVTDFCFKAESLDERAYQNGGALLSSYNNDGESGTFDLSQSVYTEQGRKGKIDSLVSFYLSGTGLLYRGID